MKKLIVTLALIASIIGTPIYGRSSGTSSSSSSSFRSSSSSSSGFRSSSSSSSPSKSWGSSSSSSSTPSKSWGSSSKSTTSSTPSKSSFWGGSSKTTTPTYTKTNGTKVDDASYKKAVQSGTVYKSKDDAIKAFKDKNQTKYTNNFDSEPASRPSYIPASTSVGGTSYNVSYNPQYHGYGYYGPSGAWMAYDTLRDVAMLSMLMDHDNYIVTSPGASVVTHHSGIGVFGWFVIIFIVLGLGVIIFAFAK